MLNLEKFVHSKTGKIMMSLILGLGLASLFRKVCKHRECVAFHAPPLEKIINQTFRDGDKCYKFTPVATKCNSNKKIITFKQESEIA